MNPAVGAVYCAKLKARRKMEGDVLGYASFGRPGDSLDDVVSGRPRQDHSEYSLKSAALRIMNADYTDLIAYVRKDLRGSPIAVAQVSGHCRTPIPGYEAIFIDEISRGRAAYCCGLDIIVGSIPYQSWESCVPDQA